MDALLRLVPLATITFCGNTNDVVVIISSILWKDWVRVRTFLLALLEQLNLNLCFTLAVISIGFFTLLQVLRMYNGFRQTSTELNGFIAKPMLFPSQTAHTRFFPQKNSFTYPFLMVGIPVGWKGVRGGMVSVDTPRERRGFLRRVFSSRNWSSWYTVDADDHLGRGHVEGGLKEKLDDYLRTQDEDPENYQFAYLLTPPRLFGYYSNPVSIWNLYSSTKQLAAMILEVNNTFNERHNYFLKIDPNSSTMPASGEAPRFTQQWPKDFHVSPYNSREGSYSISASDPIFHSLTGPGSLNTTITLSSSKGHPKLVARVFSAFPALDPKYMSSWQKITFLSKWWWVSFATFPRTVQQAVNLMWKKQMRFIGRPEPRRDTMSRDADKREIFLETQFKAYLSRVVEKSEAAFILKYTPAGLPKTESETMCSPPAVLMPREDCKYLEIKVLTPLFYSRFFSHPKALDGLLCEHHSSETVSISNPALLNCLDFGIFTPPSPLSESIFHNLNHLSLAVLRRLRSRPAPIANEELLKRKSKQPKTITHSHSSSTQSDLDHFVLFHSDGSRGDRVKYTMSF